METILRRSGTLTSQDLEASVVQANARNLPLWDFLVYERQVPEDTLADAFSTLLHLPRVRLAATIVEAAALRAVTGWLARRHTCLPIRLSGRSIVLAMANPLDYPAIQDVQFAASRQVEPVVASRTEILNGIEQHYSSGEKPGADGKTVEEDVLRADRGEREVLDLDRTEPTPSSEASSAVNLCRQIILDAIRLGASDIHIEAGPREMRVRLRIDGVLRDHLQLPRWMRTTLLSRVKVLAKLDIAQHRLPQDGRIRVRTFDRTIDLRVSTLPTHFGEKAVLRLLGAGDSPTLSALGLARDEMRLLDDRLHQPQGLILVTGPTGAGKSTTLYSMLTRRCSNEINIVTIEDPIEYQLPGVNQVQVDVKAGVTFASCLRAILRQDPDVIMVGEIRDLETAEIAFQAALTGHLVLSTLHTNSSVAAIERLIDLGVKPTTIAAATNLIVAQRLARRICMKCREPHSPSPETLRKLDLEADSWAFQHGRGCAACAQSGYSGRVGIFEILELTPKVKELVSRRATEREIKLAASGAGTRFLLEDALSKVRQGLTTIDEVLRVIRIEQAVDAAGLFPPATPPGRTAAGHRGPVAADQPARALRRWSSLRP